MSRSAHQDAALVAQETLDRLTAEQASLLTLMDRGHALRAVSERVRGRLGVAFSMVGSFVGETMQLGHLSGNRTPLLDGLDVPVGIGLGGQVLRTDRPGQVTDYLTSISITHEFDEPVGAESLHAMLAVPVHVAGRTAGVLYAALRDRHPFGDAAVDDLVSLAGEASLAMDVFDRVEGHTRAAVTAERHRTSVALHDSVGAMLFGIGAQVRDLQGLDDVSPVLLGRLTTIEQQVSAAASALRESLRALSPATGDEQLAAGVLSACRAFSDRTGVDARGVVLGALPDVDSHRQAALRSVVNEGLLNVEKHAHASSVMVSLSATGGGIALAVADDGTGLGGSSCPQPFSSGLGLASLRGRLTEVGGRLDLVQDEDGGVTLRAWVPCP